jgi:tol-pal system protein YbgF
MASAPAPAQTANETSELMNRIHQLENQVQTVSRAVFRGERRGGGAAENAEMPGDAGSSSSAAGFEVRMTQIEDQQRALTGQLEKINFDLQQLKTRLDRLQADTEQRFQQGGNAAPSGNNAPTAISPAESQTAPASGGTLGTLTPGEGGNGPAEALYEESFASIRETKYDQAESGFRDFLSRYPDHPLAANAQYWLGETYYVRGDYKQSAKMFAQGYQNFPKSAKATDSLLKLGLSLSKLGKKDDACLSLRQLQKEIPDASNPLRRRAVQEIKQLGCP